MLRRATHLLRPRVPSLAPQRSPLLKHVRHRCAESASSSASSTPIAPPTRSQLATLALASGLPFVGFGFADNFIMIVVGEQIDCTLGVKFGLSTMAAAGVGNTISDMVGISLGEVIEAGVARFLTAPPLSYEQLNLRATRLVKGSASALGIMIGCIIGMCPLLFYDDRKAVYFDDDEMNLFQLQFAPYGVTQQQYFSLLRNGTWREAEAGTVLVERGQRCDKAILLHSGAAAGEMNGKLACVYEGRVADDGVSSGLSRHVTMGGHIELQPGLKVGVAPNMMRGCIIGGTPLVEPEILGEPYPHKVTLTKKAKYLSIDIVKLSAEMKEDKHLEAAVLNTLYRDLMYAKREQKKMQRKVNGSSTCLQRAALESSSLSHAASFFVLLCALFLSFFRRCRN